MANWCSSTFIFHGNPEDCRKFYSFVHNAINPERYDNNTSDFKHSWLGNILIDLGFKDKMDTHENDEFRCRGWIMDIDIEVSGVDGVVEINTETAWMPIPHVWDFVIRQLGLDSMSYSFIAEEPSSDCYVVHNADGYNDYPEYVKVTRLDGVFADVEYYDTKEEAVKWFNDFFKVNYTQLSDFNKLITDYNTGYGSRNSVGKDRYITYHIYRKYKNN